MKKTTAKKPRKMTKKAIDAATKFYYELWGWKEGCLGQVGGLSEEKPDNGSRSAALRIPANECTALLTYYKEQETLWFTQWMASSAGADEALCLRAYRKYQALVKRAEKQVLLQHLDEE